MRLLRFCFKALAVCYSLVFLNSCVDFDTFNCDFDGYDDWRTELSLMISDFDPIFKNSNIEFVSAEPYHGRVDSLLLLNENDAFFPVSYKGFYNYMELKSKSFIQDDTTTIHMPLLVVQNMVSNTLAKGDSINWVKIEWIIDGEKKHSFAAFDKISGDFIYDNVLFNMPWFLSTITHTSKLTRSEGSGSGSGGNLWICRRQLVYRDRISVTYDGDTYNLKFEVRCDVYYDTNDYVQSFDIYGASYTCTVTGPDYMHGYTDYHSEYCSSGSGIGKTYYYYLAVDDPSISGYYDLFRYGTVMNCQYAAEMGYGSFSGGKFEGSSFMLFAYLSNYLNCYNPFYSLN